jgi:ABC-type nitrate/sulfonate/bicarbonate transport system substrate-binding protein
MQLSLLGYILLLRSRQRPVEQLGEALMNVAKLHSPFHAGVAVLAVGGCIALAACGSSSGSGSPAASASPVTIKIGTPLANAEEVPIWLGEQNGVFKKYGLNVAVAALGSGPVVTSALASGSVDVALDDATTLLSAVKTGVPIESVAQYSDATPSELIANKAWAAAHHLTAKSPLSTIVHALIGARVGAASDVITGHENVLLKSEGVQPQQVKQLTVSSSGAEQNLLVSGQLDAFVAGPPLPDEMQAAGQGVILVNEGTPSAWSDSGINLAIAVNTSWAKANAATVTKLISAIHAATADLLADPASAKSAAQANLADTSESALLYTYPLEEYSTCPTQTATLWEQDVKVGELSGDVTPGTTAPEGTAWTNQYISVKC